MRIARDPAVRLIDDILSFVDRDRRLSPSAFLAEAIMP